MKNLKFIFSYSSVNLTSQYITWENDGGQNYDLVSNKKNAMEIIKIISYRIFNKLKINYFTKTPSESLNSLHNPYY